MSTKPDQLHLRLRRRVAVKLMRAEYVASPGACRRLEREAMSGAQFCNLYVVPIHGYGIDGQPYIVMELLEGEDLDQRLARERRLALPAVLTIATQVVRALGAAHAAGIVHRDLKLRNIYYLVRTETGETVKVLDFGVSATLRETSDESPGPRPVLVLGTPSHMSPEQVCGGDQGDHRSDQQFLAVVASRALTGTLPFTAPSLSRTRSPSPCSATGAPAGAASHAVARGLDRLAPAIGRYQGGLLLGENFSLQVNKEGGVPYGVLGGGGANMRYVGRARINRFAAPRHGFGLLRARRDQRTLEVRDHEARLLFGGTRGIGQERPAGGASGERARCNEGRCAGVLMET